ncbi:competence type IV pilus minor pilin ComGG [Streptococcus didelphis]|uniref:Competence type IV pilus minor pilin ComGG n=1 Tax=Streptococcus didelphis TaxID=102886 RepID=A0ABY9LKS8_9STRE|nr:competence type IV pilus minor pilin ComGG [Streptococcus didelphis]WMB28770.1 competence type IV pilus minor pilin ComGG [Streptococcus didelphis]
MILSKRVRAGVLLYAILMAAVFTLMLQSYLTHLNDFKKEYKAHLAYSKAHLLAEILRKKS